MLKKGFYLRIEDITTLYIVLGFLRMEKIKPIPVLTIAAPGDLRETLDQFLKAIGNPPSGATIDEDDCCTIGLEPADAEKVKSWAIKYNVPINVEN